MRVAVLHTQVPFSTGGAEAQVANLVSALRVHGHKAEIVSIPFRWYPAELILDHMLASRLLNICEANGQTIDLAIGLKFPAYLIPHPKKVLWVMHQFRQAYDLWDSPYGDLHLAPAGLQIREAVRQADASCFSEAHAVYTTTRNVAARMHRFNDYVAEPIYHPPPGADRFYVGEYAPYLYFPSRIDALKRQNLVVEALARCRSAVRVVFSGAAENEAYMRQLDQLAKKLRVDDRITWKGRVEEQDKFDLYANCLAVAFPSYDEDYGYVPLEAMLASKAVLTCSDSGGGMEFVDNGETGLIVEPTAEGLADGFDRIWNDQAKAKAMGMNAGEKVRELSLSWDRVVERLLK